MPEHEVDAAEVAATRAEITAGISSGDLTLDDVYQRIALERRKYGSSLAEHLTGRELLLAIGGVGEKTAGAMLEEARLADDLTLGEMGDLQRIALVEALHGYQRGIAQKADDERRAAEEKAASKKTRAKATK